MRTRLHTALIALVAIVIASGCTSLQHFSVRDQALPFHHKIGTVSLAWRQNATLEIGIVRTATGYKPAVTETDKADARANIQQLLQTLGGRSVSTLSAQLLANGQRVLSSRLDADTLLIVTPVKGLASCAPMSCTYDLALEVSAVDRKQNKEVWRGGFKVGLTALDQLGGAKIDQGVVDSFASAVVAALKRERFI
jgi:hypothetical protein